jgi:hypothetical protein
MDPEFGGHGVHWYIWSKGLAQCSIEDRLHCYSFLCGSELCLHVVVDVFRVRVDLGERRRELCINHLTHRVNDLMECHTKIST